MCAHGLSTPSHGRPANAGFFFIAYLAVSAVLLCGEDAYSGRSYEHRKAWVEERLLAPAECFAVGFYAYAVMSNHVHVMLHVDSQVAQTWSDKEVAERWVRLFRCGWTVLSMNAYAREKARRLQGDPERVAGCVVARGVFPGSYVA